MLGGHTGRVSSVAVLASDRVVSASDDNTLRIRDLESGQPIISFVSDTAISCIAAVGNDFIAAGSANGAVHILKLQE